MDELRGPNVQIVLHLKEGQGFGFLKHPFIISGSLNSYMLEIDPVVPSHSPCFDAELIWEADKRRFRSLRVQNVPIKMEVHSTGSQGRKDKVGYLLLSLLGAQPCPANKYIDIKYSWHKLLGVKSEGKCCSPQIMLSLTIEDRINTPTPRHELRLFHRNEVVYPNKKANANPLPSKSTLMTLNEYIAESYKLVSSPDLHPRLLGEEGLMQIGKGTHIFVLSFVVASIENLDLLLQETIPFNQYDKNCLVSYSVFTHNITTDRVSAIQGDSGMSAHFNQRTTLRLLSDLTSLKRYFSECPNLVIKICYGDNDVGIGSIDLRKLVPTEDVDLFLNHCNFDKMLNIIERCFILRCDGVNIEGRRAYIDIEMSLKYGGERPDPKSCLTTRSATQLKCEELQETETETEKNRLDYKSGSCTHLDQDIGGVAYTNIPGSITARYKTSASYSLQTNELADLIRQMCDSFTKSQERLLASVKCKTSDMQVQCEPELETVENDEAKDTVAKDKVENNKVSENKVSESKVPEDKPSGNDIPETKISETKLSETKLSETKVLETKVLDSKVSENIVLENKVSENILVENTISNNIVLEKKVSENIVLVNKISENIVLENKVLENMVLENKILENVVLENIVSESKVSQSRGSENEGIEDIDEQIVLNEIESNSTKTEFSEKTNIKPPVLEKDLVKICISPSEREVIMQRFVNELEDWKEKQQELFKIQLKRKEEYHLELLSKEWNKKRMELETKLSRGIEQCRHLAGDLSRATDDFRLRGFKNNEREKKLQDAKLGLEAHYSAKYQQLREASKQLEADMNHSIKLRDIKIEELQLKLANAEKQVDTLKNELQNTKEDASVRHSGLTKDQTANLIEELRSLEEKLDNTMQAKTYFKQQWCCAEREVHLLKQARRKEALLAHKGEYEGLYENEDEENESLKKSNNADIKDLKRELSTYLPTSAVCETKSGLFCSSAANDLDGFGDMKKDYGNLRDLLARRENLITMENPDEAAIRALNNEIRSILLHDPRFL